MGKNIDQGNRSSTACQLQARLASALGRRDQEPNIVLAREIARSDDRQLVAGLIEILSSGKQALRNDAVKVLYEVGERRPALISEHLLEFLTHMRASNNRLVWGSLTAIACIAQVEPAAVFANLADILAAADDGSVIAKDQAIIILATLAANSVGGQQLTRIMCERLQTCATNQLPMYAEKIAAVATERDKPDITRVLQNRLSGEMPASKRKRLTRVVNQLLDC